MRAARAPAKLLLNPFRRRADGHLIQGATLLGRRILKEEREHDQNKPGARGWNQPGRRPIDSAIRPGITLEDESLRDRSHEHACAVGDESDKALRGRANLLARLLIDVDLSRHEEE